MTFVKIDTICLKPAALLQERLVESFHVRPKLDTCHGKVALKAFRKIPIQFCVLFVAQLKIVRDCNRVGCRFTFGKKRGSGLQSHFMCDNPNTAFLGE